jgi:MazG family protein
VQPLDPGCPALARASFSVMSRSTPEPPSQQPDLPPLPPIRPEEQEAFAAILGLVRRLRAPDGCPWDREQTLRTMTPYIIEESYEVIDAIERNDAPGLCEEIGDLVFLLLFCAEIGGEESWFSIDELLEQHVQKMVARHPHVFGDKGRLESGAAAQQWEEIKQAEHKGTDEGRGGDKDNEKKQRSVLDGRVPSLPALTAAFRIQEKAAAVGFDWKETIGALDKLEEEIAELKTAIAEAGKRTDSDGGTAGAKEAADPAVQQREEIGDLLFSVVNVARRLRVDPESALRGAVAKFIRRFRHIEERLASAGTRPSQAGLEEMDRLWEEAKTLEGEANGRAAEKTR